MGNGYKNVTEGAGVGFDLRFVVFSPLLDKCYSGKGKTQRRFGSKPAPAPGKGVGRGHLKPCLLEILGEKL
ncbi:hypothetical protein GCM10007362_50650 [Saccharibacillus endophyticus]|uniref:Uncharacterized protein n=1 Tax=Saccharibacillus endophyticus TaxID=2060666 RepID=A0ABQ2A7R1_9BACL|nr:hypothetical protein GCM10007362_50650 [Saccharibacillus endophyticus]